MLSTLPRSGELRVYNRRMFGLQFVSSYYYYTHT